MLREFDSIQTQNLIRDLFWTQNLTRVITYNANTIVLIGYKGKREFSILVDGVSTHNFTDPNAAKWLDCTLQETPSLKVAVTNGNQMSSRYKYPEIK